MIRLQTPDVMTHLKSSQLPTGNYLRELHVLEIADGQMDSTGDSRIDAVMMAATGGEPQVSNDSSLLANERRGHGGGAGQPRRRSDGGDWNGRQRQAGRRHADRWRV